MRMMTYKLNSSLGKIVSPVVLVLPDGGKMRYGSGAELERAVFEKRYQVDALRAVEDMVELVLEETEPLDGTDSFF